MSSGESSIHFYSQDGAFVIGPLWDESGTTFALPPGEEHVRRSAVDQSLLVQIGATDLEIRVLIGRSREEEVAAVKDLTAKWNVSLLVETSNPIFVMDFEHEHRGRIAASGEFALRIQAFCDSSRLPEHLRNASDVSNFFLLTVHPLAEASVITVERQELTRHAEESDKQSSLSDARQSAVGRLSDALFAAGGAHGESLADVNVDVTVNLPWKRIRAAFGAAPALQRDGCWANGGLVPERSRAMTLYKAPEVRAGLVPIVGLAGGTIVVNRLRGRDQASVIKEWAWGVFEGPGHQRWHSLLDSSVELRVVEERVDPTSTLVNLSHRGLPASWAAAFHDYWRWSLAVMPEFRYGV